MNKAMYKDFAYSYDLAMGGWSYPKMVRWIEICWEMYGGDRIGLPRKEEPDKPMPKHVVDLGCGTGNVTLHLALKGYRMVGIDASADMLTVAANKWKRMEVNGKGGSLELLNQDVRDWISPMPCDSIISTCNALSYLLHEKDVRLTFEQAHRNIKPQGLFIFDVHTIGVLERYAESQPFVHEDEVFSQIWKCRLQKMNDTIIHAITVFVKREDGSYTRIHEKHTQRAYPIEWTKRVLEDAGFEVMACLTDYSTLPASDESEQALFVAKKR